MNLKPLWGAVFVLAVVASCTWWYAHSEQQRLRICMANQESIAEALSSYSVVRVGGFLPAKLDTLVSVGFISQLPRCPTCPDRDYVYQRYSDLRAGDGYVVSCPGAHFRIDSGYPRIHDRIDHPVLSPRKFRVDYHDPTDPNWEADFEAEPLEQRRQQLNDLEARKAKGVLPQWEEAALRVLRRLDQ